MRLRVSAAIALWAGIFPGAAGAADCPTTLDVQAELTRLLPDTNAAIIVGGVASISDDGASYRVTIGGAQRSFDDEGRRCDERARTAAAFIASTLEPPRLPQVVITPSPPPLPILPAPPVIVPAKPLTAKQAYPRASIDRPLILPRLMAQGSISADLEQSRSTDQFETISSLGASLALGVDLGITRRFQAGVYFAFPLHPNADFGTFLANAQVGLHKLVNLRVDVGVERALLFTPTFAICPIGFGCPEPWTIHHESFFRIGVGLPFKWKFHRMFALVSGGTAARDSGIAANLGPNETSNSDERTLITAVSGYIGNGQFSNSIFTIAANGSATVGSFHLPIGILFQPHPAISLTVRTGYLVGFASLPVRSTLVVQRIPLAADLSWSVIRLLDIGFTFQLPGLIAASQDVGNPQSAGYGDIRLFSCWIQGRI